MKGSIKRGFLWTGIEKLSIQIVQFALGIVIARFITPEEYGVLGIIMVFIIISQVFIDSGFGSAIICRNDLNERDLYTAFTFNLVVSIFFMGLMIVLAAWMERLLDMPKLHQYIIVSSFVLITNAIIVVPTSILKVKMDFKAIAISNLVSTVISGIAGVWSAILGYGVWALIIQMISKSFLQAILMTIQCHWLPKLIIYKESFLQMYKYSLGIFGTACITKVTGEGISLFIAKILSPYDLGLFTRANQFASFAGTSIGSIFNTVLFPAFSSIKDDKKNFTSLYYKNIVLQGAIIIPIFLFLAMVAKPLILLLLTEKWVGVILIFQILCIGRILSTVSIVTEQAICGVGRSDLEFKQQVWKLLLKIGIILIAFQWGIIAIAVADAVSTICSFFITNYFGKKCLEISSSKQLYLLAPYILYAFLAAFAGFAIMHISTSHIIEIILALTTATTIYLSLLWIYKRREILPIIKPILCSVRGIKI